MFLTYRYRLYPSKEQEEILSNWLEVCRQVWNGALQIRKTAYEEKRPFQLGDLSEGSVFANPRCYRSFERKLRRAHRRLSRKKKGSNSRGASNKGGVSGDFPDLSFLRGEGSQDLGD